jgi:transcriptional regulator with XRE-family HTH domain
MDDGQVRRRREALGWPRRRLAERSGVTERTIINVEQGACVPKSGTLAKLDRALAEGEGVKRDTSS